jgi:hypothetical protein
VTEKHTFLSDDWFTAVAAVVSEHGVEVPPHAAAKVNLVVNDTPFGEPVAFHMGAGGEGVLFAKGHLDDADVTLTTDYVTAAEVFVSGNPQAGMQAFMSGKVKVQGDMAKLMASQAAGAGPRSPEMQQKIQDLTDVPG